MLNGILLAIQLLENYSFFTGVCFWNAVKNVLQMIYKKNMQNIILCKRNYGILLVPQLPENDCFLQCNAYLLNNKSSKLVTCDVLFFYVHIDMKEIQHF